MKIPEYLYVGTLICVGGVGLLGPNKPKDIYLEGVVEKEAGSVAQIVESSGAWFGNESVKLGDPTYIIQIKTSEGAYTVSVLPSRGKTLEALSLTIEKGDRVTFKKSGPSMYPLSSERFGKDRIGSNYAEDITVLDK